MLQHFSGQTAIITGGGSGIGYAIAAALGAAGANLVITSRNGGRLEQAAAQLRQTITGEVVAITADVRSRDDAQRVAGQTLARFGRIDMLINNSGLGVGDRVIDLSEENWNLVMDTCAKGSFLFSQAVLPAMQAQRRGFILNIASQAALNGYANASVYCAAKFAVLGFAKALQEEVRDYGIRVHSLCPGLVQVPPPAAGEAPRPGWLQVSDLADQALFVLSRPPHVHLDTLGSWGLNIG